MDNISASYVANMWLVSKTSNASTVIKQTIGKIKKAKEFKSTKNKKKCGLIKALKSKVHRKE